MCKKNTNYTAVGQDTKNGNTYSATAPRNVKQYGITTKNYVRAAVAWAKETDRRSDEINSRVNRKQLFDAINVSCSCQCSCIYQQFILVVRVDCISIRKRANCIQRKGALRNVSDVGDPINCWFFRHCHIYLLKILLSGFINYKIYYRFYKAFVISMHFFKKSHTANNMNFVVF